MPNEQPEDDKPARQQTRPTLRPASDRLEGEDLLDAWALLTPDERLEGFSELSRAEADEFFLALTPRDQSSMLGRMPEKERRLWLRLLAPDDAADVIQHLPEERDKLLDLLDAATRREVTALLAYAEDAAGGLMSPRFARLQARNDGRRSDPVPAQASPGTPGDNLLRLRSRQESEAGRRGFVSRSVLSARRKTLGRGDAVGRDLRRPIRSTKKPSRRWSLVTISAQSPWSTQRGA